MINNKGLTDEEINELVDEKIERDKWFEEVYLPMVIKTNELVKFIRELPEGSLKSRH